MSDDLRHATVDTPIGPLTVAASGTGLRALSWPGRPPPAGSIVDAGHPVAGRAIAELVAYFAGQLQRFTVPLDPIGTPFQQRAWSVLATIAYGTTTTYGDLAARQGGRRFARAVGAANGANPLPIVVPCHRVIGADGSLTGFAGGLDAKRFLLDLESRHR
jgi:methylated-DNA-[protein]-cysteine S-methyltransferase